MFPWSRRLARARTHARKVVMNLLKLLWFFRCNPTKSNNNKEWKEAKTTEISRKMRAKQSHVCVVCAIALTKHHDVNWKYNSILLLLLVALGLPSWNFLKYTKEASWIVLLFHILFIQYLYTISVLSAECDYGSRININNCRHIFAPQFSILINSN